MSNFSHSLNNRNSRDSEQISGLTENVTVISHGHGRERRLERNIEKRDLQAAIKYGVKTSANPGQDGSQRWRYTHNGVVYLTDATSKHEITSWRENDTENEVPMVEFGSVINAGPYSSHIVLVVDCSGSMRTSDVSGFATRTAAVYECLAREFVEPQLALLSSNSSSADMGATVVSLIEMSNEAIVRLQRVPISEHLLVYLRERRDSYATSHGNYLPALESLRELMLPDLHLPVQLMAVFLSDGAPSDHVFMECPHGVMVWQQEKPGSGLKPGSGPGSGSSSKGEQGRGKCSKGNNSEQRHEVSKCRNVPRCRQLARQSVAVQCVELVKAMGDEFGRDRIRLHTVAFGPHDEDYQVLEAMAQVLPRSSCQKLGLVTSSLRSAISSLSSNLSSMRMATNSHNHNNSSNNNNNHIHINFAGMARQSMTRRLDLVAINPDLKSDLRREPGIKISKTEFEKISVYQIMAMWLWDRETSNWIDHCAGVCDGLEGRYIGKKIKYFSCGGERVAFECQELILRNKGKNVHQNINKLTGEGTVSRSYVRDGPRLVAKESMFVESHLMNLETYRAAAERQAAASEYARQFNTAVRGHPLWSSSWNIYVLNCCIYEVVGVNDSPRQQDRLSGNNWILTEPELEGKFIKWNNNIGYRREAQSTSASLGAILEENEEDEEEGRDNGSSGFPQVRRNTHLTTYPHRRITEDDVIQAFSHFTLRVSDGQELVCDLQGIYNATDGFTLTDPTINSSKGKGTTGLTDRGQEGIDKFMDSHVCSGLCRWLLEGGYCRPNNPLSSPSSHIEILADITTPDFPPPPSHDHAHDYEGP